MFARAQLVQAKLDGYGYCWNSKTERATHNSAVVVRELFSATFAARM